MLSGKLLFFYLSQSIINVQLINNFTKKTRLKSNYFHQQVSYSYAQDSETIIGKKIIIRATASDSSAKSCKNDSLSNLNMQCADCNTLLYCKTNLTFKCPSTRPYCDNSKCVVDMPSSCEVDPGNVCPLQSDNRYYPGNK